MITVTLEEAEWQFLVTVLRGTTAILQSLAAVGDTLPEAMHVPITSETLVNVRELADRIDAQTLAAR